MSGDVSRGAAVEQQNPTPIAELNSGVRQFFEDVKADDVTSASAEVAVVVFSDAVSCLVDFDAVERISPPDIEIGGGGTHIGAGVGEALRLLDMRKAEYQDAGVDYYQPWLVLMTDGSPTDDSHVVAAREVQERLGERKLTVFPIAIGAGADLGVLRMFATAKRPPLTLRGVAFRRFFEWLSRSAEAVGRSIPAEHVDLPDVDDWANPAPPDADW